MFRFVVETVGQETVFFVRREGKPDEKIEGIFGYGHTMPEAYTTLDGCVHKSASHQRLIRYDFDGFDCIIRHEADGYLSHMTEEGLSFDGGISSQEYGSLRLIGDGKPVPQAAVFDIKTRSITKAKEDVLADEIPRLWLRQIPNFILAFHERGLFKDVQVMDVREQMAEWESSNGDALRIFSKILAMIVSHARRRPDTRFEVCCRHQGVLELREVGGEPSAALPDDLKRVWSGGGGQNVDADGGAESDDGHVDDYLGSDTDDASDDVGFNSDVEPDYTACAERCGYCGCCKC
jgi:hypothetical protein